ncbi:MAG: recombinase RecA [Bacteroidia bacterium]|nr:MAG: recombinase RecA [Bacteroidia bacterium]
MAEKENNTVLSGDRFEQMDPDRRKALALALEKIEKDYGKGAVMSMSEGVHEDVAVIPSGSIMLDCALGIGGFPRGRVIEIYGPESSGKTTLAIHAIAQVQKLGGVAAIIDAEHAFDPSYAANLGVDMSFLLISQPDNGEQALEIVEQLVRSGAVDLVVVDSVAALTPKAEIEGDMGDAKVGLQARLMSQALRKLTGTISKTQTACIFINQLRDKIGGMAFGPTETTTGGNALKFYASLRIDIRKSTAIKDSNDEQLGNRVRIRIVKNKMSPPFRRLECDLIYGEGLSRGGELMDLGMQYGLIQKSGAWFSYEGTKLGQGRENVRRLLNDNAELADELEAKIRERIAEDPSKLKFV